MSKDLSKENILDAIASIMASPSFTNRVRDAVAISNAAIPALVKEGKLFRAVEAAFRAATIECMSKLLASHDFADGENPKPYIVVHTLGNDESLGVLAKSVEKAINFDGGDEDADFKVHLILTDLNKSATSMDMLRTRADEIRAETPSIVGAVMLFGEHGVFKPEMGVTLAAIVANIPEKIDPIPLPPETSEDSNDESSECDCLACQRVFLLAEVRGGEDVVYSFPGRTELTRAMLYASAEAGPDSHVALRFINPERAKRRNYEVKEVSFD